MALKRIGATIEGDIDLRGILGLSNKVRNGYQGIRLQFKLQGDAPAKKLREIVEQSRERSAVFDTITTGVPIAIRIDTTSGSATRPVRRQR